MGARRVRRAYADLADRKLAATLVQEDLAQLAGQSPFERISCRVHRRWVHECIASPAHVVAVSGYRWCDTCAVPANVSVDHLLGTVQVWCDACGRRVRNEASEQIVRTCQSSLRATRADSLPPELVNAA